MGHIGGANMGAGRICTGHVGAGNLGAGTSRHVRNGSSGMQGSRGLGNASHINQSILSNSGGRQAGNLNSALGANRGLSNTGMPII